MKIVFLGNMNNIVYAVAKSLHEKNYDVTFLVDAPKDVLLDRPESYDPELKDNYPAWIKEVTVKEKMKGTRVMYPTIFLKQIMRILNDHDVIFLNGWWISLGKHLESKKLVINVFAGYDLDFANEDDLNVYVDAFYTTPLRKLFPRFAIKAFYRKLIKTQAAGIRRANIVNY
ncbi:MAG: hypothetical protein ACXWC7_19550 [Chitinophagaceae bacterium]